MAALIYLEFSKSQQAMGNPVKTGPICCARCNKEIFWLSNICFSVVSLAVMSGKKEIFKKESQVEIRELRLLTEVNSL